VQTNSRKVTLPQQQSHGYKINISVHMAALEVGYTLSDDQSLHRNNQAHENQQHHTLVNKPQSDTALFLSFDFTHR
jgi:hypothetical protein